MGWLFEDLGLDKVDKSARRRVHEALVAELGLSADAHCPEVWAATKERYNLAKADEQSPAMASDLAQRLGRS